MLLVGTYNGIKGGYNSIQAAVNAAKPGDWILIGPGDYHETADQQSATDLGRNAGGGRGGRPHHHERPHTARDEPQHGDRRRRQGGRSRSLRSGRAVAELRDRLGTARPTGRNGIVVFKANDVSVENLTACNFLSGNGDAGNEIWWNGGDGSGKIGLNKYWGSYLTATTTYYGGEATAAAYGIFSSNSAGPAGWNQIYANNFNDSGMYVGACQQVCDVTIDNAWMEYNALGYSGTNSGGAVVIENSQFDNNEDGADTNTQIDGDPPAPQNGACPDGGISPITHTHSCWVFMHNYVHNNNNPNSPAAGSAAAGPYGTGMTVSGARNVTVMDNTFSDNGAWGTLFVPYPDSGTPSLAPVLPEDRRSPDRRIRVRLRPRR